MHEKEKLLNECLSYISHEDVCTSGSQIGTPRYRRNRKRIAKSAIENIAAGHSGRELVKRTRADCVKECGMSPVEIAMLLVQLARIVQMVWSWWTYRQARHDFAIEKIVNEGLGQLIKDMHDTMEDRTI